LETDEAPGVTAPLAELRVLELTHYLAGPYCTAFLADLGADVIKIESPEHPDLGRAMPGCRIEGEPAYFHQLNRNKRSVALDLKDERGRAAFHRLVGTAHVVVDNFRHGVTARLGADPETLRGVNPRIVTCSLTGFGATGPKRDLPAYDYLVQALSGIMSLTGDPGGKPTKYGISIVDHTSGLMGAFAVLAALRQVERTGEGCHVDLALLDSHVHMLTYLAADYLNGGLVPERYQDSAHPYIVPSQRFSTADGDLVIMPMADHMWRALCEAMGLDELADDPRLATAPGRLAQRERVSAVLAEAFATRTTREWVSALQAAGVPVAPVNTVPEILADPQVEARELVVDAEGVKVLGNPVKISGHVQAPWRRAPHVGAHTRELLLEVGLSGPEVDLLWPEGTGR
jgi:crotonobetainyl-CoA:carnitine CoA-transferase CaiB-like acyl-CoA transferase